MSTHHTFAFVDLAGYTALTEAHGDEGAADCAARFYELASAARAGDTRIVKRIGDAVMFVSGVPHSCTKTVLSLLAATQAEPDFPNVRAGIASGQAVERDNDYFGSVVNVAARIAAHARAGEVLCDAAVAEALDAHGRARVVPLGLVALKNVTQPVPVFSVLPLGPPETAGAVDPVCRMVLRTPKVVLEHDGENHVFCSDACADRFRATPDLFLR